jgi:hypothetical protein
MTQQIEAPTEFGWGKFIRKYWTAFTVFIMAAILAAAGAVYVFVWFTATDLVPSTLGLWTMGNTVDFILHAIFWELVLIGIPVAIGAIIGWQWWKRIPEEEKRTYHFSGKSSRSRNAGGAVSPLLFVAFAIKVYVDGNWNVAIATFSLNYVVGSMLTILFWTVAIFAIPAMGLIWWIHRKNAKTA